MTELTFHAFPIGTLNSSCGISIALKGEMQKNRVLRKEIGLRCRQHIYLEKQVSVEPTGIPIQVLQLMLDTFPAQVSQPQERVRPRALEAILEDRKIADDENDQPRLTSIQMIGEKSNIVGISIVGRLKFR